MKRVFVCFKGGKTRWSSAAYSVSSCADNVKLVSHVEQNVCGETQRQRSSMFVRQSLAKRSDHKSWTFPVDLMYEIVCSQLIYLLNGV